MLKSTLTYDHLQRQIGQRRTHSRSPMATLLKFGAQLKCRTKYIY